MGLLSSAFAKGFVKGVGENIVDWQDEVKEKEDLYNENLTKAKRRVNEITTELGRKYDDSVSLVNRYGGGAFGNYLVQNYSFDQLSDYNNLAPSVQEEQIETIKAEFDRIKDKSAFTNADFTKTAKEKLDEQVQATKTSTISQIAGEAPVAPTGKIGQVLTGGIRAGAEREREKIMGGFAEPVTTAEYAPIDRDFQVTVDLPKVDRGDILSYLKNTIDTLSFSDQESRTVFENDYNTLVTGTPQEKAAIEQKYYYPVSQTKMPITPSQTSDTVTGQIDEVDYTDILEDTDPNYSG